MKVIKGKMGGVSAIAKRKKVFSVPHKELKSHVSKTEKSLMAGEPHIAHP